MKGEVDQYRDLNGPLASEWSIHGFAHSPENKLEMQMDVAIAPSPTV